MTKYFQKGDALVGDKIIARARKVVDRKLVHHTGKDKALGFALVGSAYCVIDRPIRSVREKKS